MKVALLDLTPLWGGVVKWGTYLVEELGIDYLVWHKPKFNPASLSVPITIMKGSDAKRLEILDQYDFILVASLHFEITEKQREYRILKQCRVPWTFMVHNFHKFKKDPDYVVELLENSNFTNIVPTTSLDFVWDIQKKLEYTINSVLLPNLPYRRVCDNGFSYGKDIIMTSRVVGSKGGLPLVREAQGLGRNIRLHGATYELRSGVTQCQMLREKIQMMRGEEPVSVKSYAEKWDLWDEMLPTGETVSWLGEYDDFRTVMDNAALHVNLTGNTLAVGHLEYVTLEAMDYGVPVMVPDSHVNSLEGDQVFKVNDYMRGGKYDKLALQDTLKKALTITKDEAKYMVDNNRKVLDEYYNASQYASQIKKLWS